MKVLIVNTVDTARNGITNVIFNHLRELSAHDIIFDMVVKNELDSRYLNFIKDNRGQVFIFPRNISKIASYIYSLRKLIKSKSYDIVHIHGNSHTLIIELIAAMLGGCKVRIIHAHNTSCGCMWIHKSLSFLFHVMCTHRLACGTEAGKFMYGNHPFEVLRNGIDVKQYLFDNIKGQSVRKQFCIEDAIVLGHVGGFNEAKNQSFLLDVLKGLLEIEPKYTLLLIGDGYLIEQVKEKAKKLNIEEHVVFAGETDKISEYLSAMDIFLMPSLYEGLPLTMIEAQANGLVCVASDRITDEVDLTGNIQFLSIDDGAISWIKTILGFKFKSNRIYDSKAAIDCIIKNGYNIQGEAQKLLEYYCEAIQR